MFSTRSCLSFLNLCRVFNANLLYFMNSLWSFLRLSITFCFFLDGLFYSQVELLVSSFNNFQNQVFILWHTFLCLLRFYLHYLHALSNYRFSLFIQQIFPPELNFINPVTVFFSHLVMVCSTHNLKYQTSFPHLLQCLCKDHLFLCTQWNCIYSYNTILLFHHILVLNNHTKTFPLIFYLIIVSEVLNTQVYPLLIEFFSFLLLKKLKINKKKKLLYDSLVLILNSSFLL